jgi:2-phospho-L-lactate guanylyltransferase
MTAVVALPIKPFAAAKQRLAAVLSVEQRRSLSKALAGRSADTAIAAGALPLVLAADEEVARWAEERGIAWIPDRGLGLDGAATGAVEWSTERGHPWIICHADLPLLGVADLSAAIRQVESGRPVIAASTDGGTSLIGAQVDRFDFAYGPGSFHRHLARLQTTDPVILSRIGLSLDVDEPADLIAAGRHRRAAWLGPYLPASLTSRP